MNLKKWWFENTTGLRKLTSIKVRFVAKTKEKTIITSKEIIITFSKVEGRVFNGKDFYMWGFALAKAKQIMVDECEEDMRKKAYKFHKSLKKTKFIDNETAIIKTKDISRVIWEVSDTESEKLTYEEYLEWKPTDEEVDEDE